MFPVPRALRSSSCFRTLAWLVAGSPLLAQAPLSGALSGSLAPGVYHTTGHIAVAAGNTLTLPAGVIIKFSGHQFTIDGTLQALGTPGNPVVFTHIQDDSAGGDTNGNGPSVGAPGGWYGIALRDGSDASVLDHADVRYGGHNFVSNLELDQSDATLTHCSVRDCFTAGMDLNANSRPTVHDCAFVDNGSYAVQSAAIDAVPGFAGNTASGNAGGAGDYMLVTAGVVTGNLTIGPAQMINGVLVVDSHVAIAAGATLAFTAGTIVKFAGADQVTVDGTLLVGGAAANPCVFTGLADDSAGGDSNGNGPSTGSPGAWYGIALRDGSDASVLDHADVRYGGHNFVSNLELDQSDATFRHCTVRNCFTAGMDLNANSRPTVADCTFVGNGSYAVQSVAIDAVPGFAGNTASGNAGGAGDYMLVTAGVVTGNLTIGPAQMINGVLVVDSHVAIAAGATLSFTAGTIVKFAGAYQVTVDGTLLVGGTGANPCVFTGLADDSAGGDSNGNGPSTGSPGAWYGIALRDGSDASVLDRADVRYGGHNFVSNLELDQSDATFRHCTVRNCFTAGMDLNANSRPTVADCTFVDNGSYAVQSVAIDAVPGFADNTASGNAAGAGDYMLVTSGVVTGSLRIGSQSLLHGALVVSTHVTVPAGAALTIEQGVVCKFASAVRVVVDGALQCLGTGYEPIVFTSLADDQYAGDTNGNGPSTGSPGAWYGLLLNGGSSGWLENVVVRHGGHNFAAGIDCASPLVVLRAVRADRCFSHGFELAAAVRHAYNLVAWDCGGIGIHLTGGGFLLFHATATGNGTGIRREAAWTGSVINSIAWGNGANFVNFTASQVSWSDGFVGGTGNLDVDPVFVDRLQGDLRLDALSPCLGVAELAYARRTGKDHDENSRVTDHLLSGVALPDMGAFERQVWGMTVTGVPRPGSTVTFQLQGPPGLSYWSFGVMEGSAWVDPWGVMTVGVPGQTAFLLLPWLVPTGTPVPLPLVNDPSLVGAIAGFQTLTFGPVGIAGNFTRLYRGLVRP